MVSFLWNDIVNVIVSDEHAHGTYTFLEPIRFRDFEEHL